MIQGSLQRRKELRKGRKEGKERKERKERRRNKLKLEKHE
jgi:hypothetical protein